MVKSSDKPNTAHTDPPERTGVGLAALHAARNPEARALLDQAMSLGQSPDPGAGRGLAIAATLDRLGMDAECLAAGLLLPACEAGRVDLAEVERRLGPGVAALVRGAVRMGSFPAYRGAAAAGGLAQTQVDRLRKMLLSVVEDVRMVLIRLADRLQALEQAARLGYEDRRELCRETLDIYAPLANRLGVRSLKWELEDLAFRYLDPDTYGRIARLLEERRQDRERYVEAFKDALQQALQRAGIAAEVSGRPKHIYSIWRKMQRKQVGFHKVFDVRAVRVLVADVTACYAALGLVHSLWPHIPGEFDDYIARPKNNLYRSLHTAVQGPEDKVVEIQIRTHEMHRHAEYGVAAHWRYKEGVGLEADRESRVAWLRGFLESGDENLDGGDLIERFKAEAFHDRVYVLTPQGQVLDLPQGATPLDFAYAIHTEVGHRCRGAKVDGAIVPLTHVLDSGEQVEILTAKRGGPSRDWLNPHLGYLATDRARAKVRQWFKHQDFDNNVAQGREALERKLKRLGLAETNLQHLAEHFRFPRTEEFLAAVGRGEITSVQIAGALGGQVLPAAGSEAALKAPPPRRAVEARTRGVRVAGIDNLLTRSARCCKPLPDDPVVGYITQGQGVTIHRQDCANLLRLSAQRPDRLVQVDWPGGGLRHPVDVFIEAYDRQGLLRDISSLLSGEKVNILAANTLTDRASQRARMTLTLEVADAAQLSRVLDRIGQLRNVFEVHRKG